jgi:thymidylate kinase
VAAMLPSVRPIMRRQLFLRSPAGTVARFVARQLRRLDRWVWPRCGLHLVFLGPDGVGKSTVIDEVQQRIAPAFLHAHYQTFARGILPTRPKKSPHALPPRSLPASLVKAAWWLLCYGPGYLRSVHPTLARGGLAINHRYLVDAVVDPHRYRYSGSIKLIRWIWRFVPKPDLIIFLDAPVEVICARKQEMPAEELTELRAGYLKLAATLPNARVVTTNQSLGATVNDVTDAVFDQLSRRIVRRTDLK